MNLAGKVVMITGAAGDIGFATAKAFITEGAIPVLIDRNEKSLSEAVKKLKLIDIDNMVDIVDVTSEAEVENLFQSVIEKFGKIDVVVNNVGIAGAIKPIEEMSFHEFQYTMKVNVYSVFLGIKYALPLMKEQGCGSIINMTSDAAERGTSFLSDYIASKHAVCGLTKSAAIEGAPFNVRVNAVSPTSINGSMMDRIMSKSGDVSYNDKIPFGRFGFPDEVSQIILFLASNRASYVTGSTYRVDGGRLTV